MPSTKQTCILSFITGTNPWLADNHGGQPPPVSSSSAMNPGYGSNGQPPYGHGAGQAYTGNAASNGPTHWMNHSNGSTSMSPQANFGAAQFGAASGGAFGPGPAYSPALGMGGGAEPGMMPTGINSPDLKLPRPNDWGNDLPDIMTETRTRKVRIVVNCGITFCDFFSKSDGELTYKIFILLCMQPALMGLRIIIDFCFTGFIIEVVVIGGSTS